jgi:hypothetical protein
LGVYLNMDSDSVSTRATLNEKIVVIMMEVKD